MDNSECQRYLWQVLIYLNSEYHQYVIPNSEFSFPYSSDVTCAFLLSSKTARDNY